MGITNNKARTLLLLYSLLANIKLTGYPTIRHIIVHISARLIERSNTIRYMGSHRRFTWSRVNTIP